MANEHEGVSPASAVEGEPRGYGGPDPRDTDPGKLREIANALHALLGEEDCTERAVTLGHLWYLVRLVAGLLDAISDRNRPGPPKPDPRDAEIERLRGEVEGLESQRDRRQTLWQTRYGQLIGGALDVQQHLQRALGKPALPSDKFDPDYSRSMVDGLKAERDRLRQESGSLFRKLCAALDVNPAGETWASFVTRVGALVGERDEAREEWKRADAEVTRLARCYDAVTARADSVEAERDDYAGRLRDTDAAYAKVTAERDLFRDALVAINGAIGQTERLAAAITADKREPRRWRAGDPEPEIGVTVDYGDGNYYTLRDDGIWYRSSDSAGYSWKWLTGRREHLPLVEVVNSDGD